jgi:hypothetical protein
MTSLERLCVIPNISLSFKLERLQLDDIIRFNATLV